MHTLLHPTSAASSPPNFRSRYPGELLGLFARDRLAAFQAMAMQGDVVQARYLNRLVFLMHPDDIRRVLVTEQKKFTKGWTLGRSKVLLGEGLLTSTGQAHLRRRRLIQPALHRERLLGYGQVMIASADKAIGGWEDGERLDFHEEMMRVTLVIAGRTLFDVDVEEETQGIGEVLDLSLQMFRYAVWPFGSLMEHAPLGWVRRLHEVRAQFDAMIMDMLEERSRTGYEDRGDVLSILLTAHDEEGGGGRMNDRQIRDEIVTLLLAGHETTAVALSWTAYLLSQYPDVEARLHAEIDGVLGGRAPTAADAGRLPYTRMVIAESMRLYPPVWMMERRTIDRFEAQGCVIPAGSQVYMGQYFVHRDPRWWTVPNRFDPERWTPERAAERPKFSYFPFGGGTRACIGEHFAWLEATLVLATIAQRWRLRYDEPQAPVPEALVTLRPTGGMPIRLERR